MSTSAVKRRFGGRCNSSAGFTYPFSRANRRHCPVRWRRHCGHCAPLSTVSIRSGKPSCRRRRSRSRRGSRPPPQRHRPQPRPLPPHRHRTAIAAIGPDSGPAAHSDSAAPVSSNCDSAAAVSSNCDRAAAVTSRSHRTASGAHAAASECVVGSEGDQQHGRGCRSDENSTQH